MKKENRHNIMFRYFLIIALIVMLSLRITYKLVDNTILSAKEWNAKADSTLLRIDTIMPERGDILAADGTVLATNMRVYTPCLDFRCPRFNEEMYRASIPALTDSLAKYFPQRKKSEWETYLLKPLNREPAKRHRSYPIVRKVSHMQAQHLSTFPFFKEKRRFTGFHINDELARVRPYGNMARRSIGAVGVTDKISIPFGKYGLERSLNKLLSGTPGYSKKIPLTKAIVDEVDKAPINGHDVLTTIDINLQDLLENELNKILVECKADWGTAILMEVATGDIKAITNLEIDKYSNRGYIESLNYAVMRFEPGSVIKPLSMMVMMEDGKIPNINRVITTGGKKAKFYGSDITDCSAREAVPVNRILEISSNIGMSKLVNEFYSNNPGEFYTKIKNTGFLSRFNTHIAEEVRPLFDSIAGKKPRDKRQLLSQSYGYATEISPLYTASLYNAIANDGRYVKPRIVRGLRINDVDTIYPVEYVNKQVCTPKHAAQLREMLKRVVWGDWGTARNYVQSDKVTIAGKTGTANKIEKGKYVSGVSRVSFCGFFPYENPKYTCMVMVAYPRVKWVGAASTSGQVVKNMAEAMYARGLLDNKSDFVADSPSPNGDRPVYFAETNPKIHSAIASGSNKKAISNPIKPSRGLPNVIGLSLPDAIVVLERAGYNVTFSGDGYVTSQMPKAGANVTKGQQVQLTLTTKYLTQNENKQS